MAFSLTARNIELRGSWLLAFVRKKDGDWTSSKLDLNKYIGNDNGHFNIHMTGWHDSSLSSSCRLRSSLLFAKLRDKMGHWSEERCINLNLFIANEDGKLVFKKPSESILMSGLCFQLKGTRLCGLCMAPNGMLQYSEINLDDHYANINGRFRSDDRGYAATGREFSLEVYPTALKLVGELRNCSGEYQMADVDLDVCIVNDNGQLKFVKHAGSFDKSGDITRFLESMRGGLIVL